MLRGLTRQPPNLRKGTSMSLQVQQKKSPLKRVETFEPKPTIQSKTQSKNVQQVVHQTLTWRYHQLVGGVFDTNDSTTLYMISAPTVQNYRKKHLVIKNLVYTISNWTHDKFPNVIYICLKGYQEGYLASNIVTPVDSEIGTLVKTKTSRVAALQLDQIQAVMDESQVRTYELRYTIRDSVNWQLDATTMNLAFTVKIDDSQEDQIMPLPNLLDFNCEVRASN